MQMITQEELNGSEVRHVRQEWKWSRCKILKCSMVVSKTDERPASLLLNFGCLLQTLLCTVSVPFLELDNHPRHSDGALSLSSFSFYAWSSFNLCHLYLCILFFPSLLTSPPLPSSLLLSPASPLPPSPSLLSPSFLPSPPLYSPPLFSLPLNGFCTLIIKDLLEFDKQDNSESKASFMDVV